MLTPKEIELYSLPGMQKLFREKMGPLQDGFDRICCEEFDFRMYPYQEELDSKCDKCIVIPLPIDPINPERGLSGMIDSRWKKLHDVIPNNPHIVKFEWYQDNLLKSSYGDSITEALLRALMAQEGIET